MAEDIVLPWNPNIEICTSLNELFLRACHLNNYNTHI